MFSKIKEVIKELFGIKRIGWLLYKPLYWAPASGHPGKYLTPKYDEEDCWLRMNNFPDEPLWTLYYKGETMELEDIPVLWKIKYTGNANI